MPRTESLFQKGRVWASGGRQPPVRWATAFEDRGLTPPLALPEQTLTR
jgi:hypothetical protein